MKIVNVEAIPLWVPMQETLPAPVGGETSSAHTLVKVTTSTGRVGYGEVFRLAPSAAQALIHHEFQPLLVGQDPRRIEYLWHQLYERSFRYGRAGIVLHAISGIEVALWDLLGQEAGMPLYQLLGGACRETVPAYASLHRYANPAEAAEVAQRFVKQGYSAIKLHQRDVASVAAVRNAIGSDVTLMLDASGAWTPREALAAAHALAEHDLAWLEEPLQRMDDYDGLRWLRDRSPVPIAAGENAYSHWGFRELITRRAVDIVQPDVIKVGGISACRKVMAMAEAHDLEISPHCFYFGPGIAATLHVCMASTRARFIEINPIDLESWYMQPALRPVGGHLAPSSTPGLGVAIDSATLEANSRTFIESPSPVPDHTR